MNGNPWTIGEDVPCDIDFTTVASTRGYAIDGVRLLFFRIHLDFDNDRCLNGGAGICIG
jgi:hypothetical protein